MNDLISRSKLDKKLCEKKAMYTSVATKEAFDKTISIVWEMPDETGWISVDDRLPEIERNVLIVTKSTYSGSLRVNQAFYENGEIGEGESDYSWSTRYIDMSYDEDKDDYIVPKGWYVDNDYLEEFCEVTDEVLYWRPLPEPPKED